MDRRFIKFRDNFLGDVSSRQYLKTPYLVFAAAILLTVGITYFFYKSVEVKDRSRFNADVAKIGSTIEGRINAYITLLKSGRGFLEASRSAGGKELSKDSLAVFIEGLELGENFPGAQGVGFIKKVQPGEQPALLEKMRAEGHKDFNFFPPEAADKEAYVILYLEPLGKDQNARGIGYIISSEQPKLAAIEKAIATGAPAVSEKLTLIQWPRTPEAPRRPGFQLFLPIYKTSETPDTPEKRKEQIDGLLYCPFRAPNFVHEVQKISAVSDVSFAIYDREINAESLLAESATESKESKSVENPTVAQALSRSFYSALSFEETTETNVGNEKWIVKYRTLPSFHSNSSTGWTVIIFFFGLGISLVLFFITLSQSKAHASLEIIAKDLARSEKVKDEFIAVVSHELRTPLNSIAGGVTVLRNQGINDETKCKAMDIIDKNLRLQVNLVEDMIVFSDINTGKEFLQLRPLDFSAMVERSFNEFLPEARLRNISLEKHNDLSAQMIAGDDVKLDKVFHSILSNAFKFTPPGGRVTIEAKAIDNFVELRIKDSGFGIHPHVLPYVFDLFKQGDSSNVRRYGGLGLGMTLSRHIVKLHGGTLEAASDGVDKGSVFTVRLPVLEG